MKHFFLTLLGMGLISTLSFTQTSDENQNECFEMGVFNGTYTSYHPNGQKKAEGRFEQNRRVGVWTVWDSLGNERMARKYHRNGRFEFITTNNAGGESVEIKVIPNLTKEESGNGFESYYPLKQENVLYSQRIWREIGPGGMNDVLFFEKRLFNLLIGAVGEQKELIPYSVLSDEFEIPLTTNEFIDLTDRKITLTGFKLKEDWFYDSERHVSECRIIGICPVVIFEGEETERPLFWLYFPAIRKALASEGPESSENSQVASFEAIFHERQFNSTITKISNVHDMELRDYVSAEELENEVARIEKNLIEVEHDFWIKSTE